MKLILLLCILVLPLSGHCIGITTMAIIANSHAPAQMSEDSDDDRTICLNQDTKKQVRECLKKITLQEEKENAEFMKLICFLLGGAGLFGLGIGLGIYISEE